MSAAAGCYNGPPQRTAHAERPRPVSDDLETGGHLADRLSADRRERTEVGHLHEQQERDQRRQRKHAQLIHLQFRHAQGEVDHRQVDAQHMGAGTRHGVRQNAATTAYIEYSLTI